MKPRLRPTLLVLGIAACASMAFVPSLKPVSAGAWAFWSLWLAWPDVAMGAALLRLSWRDARLQPDWQLGAILVAMAGLAFLAYAVFWNSDAQGALAVLMTPIVQAVAAIALLPLFRQLRRTRRG